MNSHSAVVVNNVLYLVGTHGFYNWKIDKYDPSTKSFVTVKSMDIVRNQFGICQYDDESFIVAGGKIKRGCGIPKKTNTSYLYNTSTNEIKYLGGLNNYKFGLVLVNCLGSVYALGGEYKNNTIEKLNPTTNKWEIMESKLKIGRYEPGAVSYNEFIYVFGGEIKRNDNRTIVSNSIEKVNVLTGEVKMIESEMIGVRSSFGIIKINSDVYLMSGHCKKPGKPRKVTYLIEVFNLESEKFTELARSSFKSEGCIASVLEIEK